MLTYTWWRASKNYKMNADWYDIIELIDLFEGKTEHDYRQPQDLLEGVN
jgi:hypothetical protein